MEWLKRCYAIVLLLLPIAVFTWVYPNKPMQVIVPYPPGGLINVTVCIVIYKLGERLGQQVVINGRGFASGSIASALFLKRAKDQMIGE